MINAKRKGFDSFTGAIGELLLAWFKFTREIKRALNSNQTNNQVRERNETKPL